MEVEYVGRWHADPSFAAHKQGALIIADRVRMIPEMRLNGTAEEEEVGASSRFPLLNSVSRSERSENQQLRLSSPLCQSFHWQYSQSRRSSRLWLGFVPLASDCISPGFGAFEEKLENKEGNL
jgi:hypothetical protein